jgi:ribosomal protein S18 acetylase RimI-like enzyme
MWAPRVRSVDTVGRVFLIEAATVATEEVVEAIGRLLPHLSKSSPAPTQEEVAEIVTSPATTLFVARDGEGGPIVGTLTLAIFRIPTGVRAWIEDVIADPSVSGRGLGAQLTTAALDAARAAGARTVELTSRPSREAANHLYRKLGFETRETNVYRRDLARE